MGYIGHSFILVFPITKKLHIGSFITGLFHAIIRSHTYFEIYL